ncbi:MAG: hypothetical protein HY958_07635 [Bacteroidia bacterium]|nr:hypothetical protein [Bacteroidia bacterium]
MKRKLSVVLALIFVTAIFMNGCKPPQKAVAVKYDYEVTSGGAQGVEGTTLIKITGKGKTAEAAVFDAKVNSVHALLFRGIPGTNMAKAIIPGANAENDHYFDTFFAQGGKFLQYLSVSGDGVQDKVKTSDGYKVTLLVSVKHAELRKFMEAEGKARKLTEGF